VLVLVFSILDWKEIQMQLVALHVYMADSFLCYVDGTVHEVHP
jgi:hypothetical protein